MYCITRVLHVAIVGSEKYTNRFHHYMKRQRRARHFERSVFVGKLGTELRDVSYLKVSAQAKTVLKTILDKLPQFDCFPSEVQHGCSYFHVL